MAFEKEELEVMHFDILRMFNKMLYSTQHFTFYFESSKCRSVGHYQWRRKQPGLGLVKKPAKREKKGVHHIKNLYCHTYLVWRKMHISTVATPIKE